MNGWSMQQQGSPFGNNQPMNRNGMANFNQNNNDGMGTSLSSLHAPWHSNWGPGIPWTRKVGRCLETICPPLRAILSKIENSQTFYVSVI